MTDEITNENGIQIENNISETQEPMEFIQPQPSIQEPEVVELFTNSKLNNDIVSNDIITTSNVSTLKKYEIVLVRENSYIVDIEGNGASILKSKYTQIYNQGDYIELPPEEN